MWRQGETNWIPEPDDSSFSAQTVAAFQFLVSDCGFGIPSFRGPNIRVPPMVGDDFEEVRFESDKVFVSISRCPSRLEWAVEIGLLRHPPDEEKGFSVAELTVLDAPEHDVHGWTSMWPDTLLPKALAERAQALKEYGRSALVGDAAIFESLATARSKRLREHWAAQRLADAARKAADAFRRKNWAEVVSLLAPLGAKLSPAQRKKLDYARKREHPQ